MNSKPNSKRAKSSSQKLVPYVNKKTKVFLPFNSQSSSIHQINNNNYKNLLELSGRDFKIKPPVKLSNNIYSYKQSTSSKYTSSINNDTNSYYDSVHNESGNNLKSKKNLMTSNFNKNIVLSPRNKEIPLLKAENRKLRQTLLSIKSEYKRITLQYEILKKEVFENGEITLSKTLHKSRPIAVNLRNQSQNEAITINTLTVSDDE